MTPRRGRSLIVRILTIRACSGRQTTALIGHDRCMAPAVSWLRAHLEDRRAEIGLIGLCLVALTVFAVHGPYGDGDIRVYHRYAVEFWAGRHAFHQLPAEYPPLALVVFTLSVLPPLHDYATVFAIWMSVVFVAGYLAFVRFESRRQAAIFFLYLIVGATSTLLARYDLIPALLSVAAFWLVVRGRYRLAYLLLAAGILLKLYPIFLIPLVMIEQRRALLLAGRPWLRDVAEGAGVRIRQRGRGLRPAIRPRHRALELGEAGHLASGIAG